jgi:hypothetical protein
MAQFEGRTWYESAPMDYEGEDPFILISQATGSPLPEMGGPSGENVELRITIWSPVGRGLVEGLRQRGQLWRALDDTPSLMVRTEGYNEKATMMRRGWSNGIEGEWRELVTVVGVFLDRLS